MRVLLVTNDYPPKPGGIQQYLANVVAAFPGEVRVLAPADSGDDPRVVRHRRPFMWPTRAVRRWVEAQATEFRPDVLLFGAPHPLALLGPGLRRSLGIPYGLICYGAEVTVRAALPGARGILRRSLRRADAVFGLSRYTCRRVERLIGRPVPYLGAGVEPAFAPGDPPERPVVGCVSRFVPRKGQRRVLRAVARLRADGRDLEVLLVGAGPDEAALRRLAARLGVPTRFAVAVPWAALPGLYRQMTVFAMPCRSRWLGLEVEGLGLVFLEAAASGLPVLAGDSGGAPETVVPGLTGYIVADDAALEEGLRLLLDDPGRAREMGRAGREKVLAEYTWEQVAERLVAGLEEAVGAGPGGGGGERPS
ncbi:MAG: glycosyltransferase family 4 protein [Actinobacteria bacterium]|nr:glycosyltransferase family 4 protein [Actinomycetota bacterium]